MSTLSRKIIYISICLLIINCFICIFKPTQSYSALADLDENPDAFNPKGTLSSRQWMYDTTIDKVKVILGYIRNIGVAVSVISLMLVGLKYMLGSVEEKAQYKETLMPIIISSFLIATVTTVPYIIYIFTTDIFRGL